jgi:hypothetical protein
MRRACLVVLTLPIVLALAACGGGDDSGDGYDDEGNYDCSMEDRADVFAVGLARPGEKGTVTVTLMASTPAPPSRGDNTWSIGLTDGAGAPITGAAVTVTPFMPDHRHGTGIKAKITEQGAGLYQATPVNLWMPGLWEITVAATPAGGAEDRAVFRFCIAS